MVASVASLHRMICALALAGTALTVLPGAARAQDDDARLRKVEAEVRALQRAVFPGSDGRFFTPEVDTGGTPAPTPATGSPATTAVTDMLVRLDALEAQVARLTGQVEENGNAISMLTARLAELEAGRAGPAQPSGVITPPGSASTSAVEPATTAAAPAAATPAPAPAPAPAGGPSAERLAAVQAIAKPQSDDAGDDEYVYGFRLWDAKFYPEAQQQLRMFVEQNPGHWRATYGRNLLGRAFLDDGQPREAATWFLQNYQADKTAARAGDSLLFLAEAMIALEDTRRACIALAEFGETYPALASGRLMKEYEAGRGKVSCN